MFDPEAPVTRGEAVTFLKRYHDNARGAAPGITRVTSYGLLDAFSNSNPFQVECDDIDQVIISGGFSAPGEPDRIGMQWSYPTNQPFHIGGPDSWHISLWNTSEHDRGATLHALCAQY